MRTRLSCRASMKAEGLAGFGVVEQHEHFVEAAVLDIARVDFGGEVVAVGAGHLVEDGAGGEDEASAGLVDGLAGFDGFEGEAHLGDAFLHGEEAGDVGFGDAEHEDYGTRSGDGCVCWAGASKPQRR